MFATQVLCRDKSEGDAKAGIFSEIVGVIIVDDKKYAVRRGESKIGRDSALCSIVINNYTVSKVHAAIESDGVDDTFIYDFNSTNQTKLGKKVLKPHCRYKLDHESKLTFGNVVAKFLFPNACNTTNLVNLNPLVGVGDIFNTATQVCIPDSSLSSGPVFKNLGVKSNTFKTPNSLTAKVKESGKNEVTICRSDSSKTKSETEFQELENSNIFNLKTQGHTYEPSEAYVKTEFHDIENSNMFNLNTQCHTCEPPEAHVKTEFHEIENSNMFNLNTQCHTCEPPEAHVKTEFHEIENCSIFNLKTQCHTCEPPEAHVKTEFHELENNNIFNLKTQCHTYEPSAAYVKTEVKTEPSDDNHNSLLNDEQDDVLSNFMNLNFLKVQDELFKKMSKTETENASHVLNISTQTKKLGEKNKLKQEEQVIKESCSSCKPSISSTTLNCKFTQNLPKNKSSTCILEGNNSSKTQEFILNAAKNIRQQNTQSKNTETEFDDTLYNFFKEQTYEDFILTQAYEDFEKKQKMYDLSRDQINEDSIPTQTFEKSYQEEVVSETKDFIKSEIVDIETEAKRNIFTNIEAHSKKDPKFYFEESLDFIQRNDQDDSITTEIFEANVKNEPILNCSDDDEDFIDSQPVETSVNKTQSKNSQKTLFQKNSPDLLCSGSSHANTEDWDIRRYIIRDNFNGKSEVPECQDQAFFQKFKSNLSSHFNNEDEFIFKKTIVLESSDDETESDLEMEDETNKYFKTESLLKNTIQSRNVPSLEDNSFEFGSENNSRQIQATTEQRRPAYLSDSEPLDLVDISSFSPKFLIKQERGKKIDFEEAQALAFALSRNFAKKNSGKGSPTCEVDIDLWSPLPLEMPSTSNLGSSSNKNLENERDKRKDFQTQSKIQKTEVETENSDEVILNKLAPADSPLKRPLDSKNADVVQFKKSKTEGLLQNTEKQCLRSVRTHDIGQIQPSKAGSSSETPTTENKPNKNIFSRYNNTNEHPSSLKKSNSKTGSAKKLNCDITLYLTTNKETKKSFGGKQ